METCKNARVFLALGLLFAVLAAAVPPALAAGGTTVSGRILDTQGGLPIPNATVVLERGGVRVGSAQTDARRKFPDSRPGSGHVRRSDRRAGLPGYSAHSRPAGGGRRFGSLVPNGDQPAAARSQTDRLRRRRRPRGVADDDDDQHARRHQRHPEREFPAARRRIDDRPRRNDLHQLVDRRRYVTLDPRLRLDRDGDAARRPPDRPDRRVRQRLQLQRLAVLGAQRGRRDLRFGRDGTVRRDHDRRRGELSVGQPNAGESRLDHPGRRKPRQGNDRTAGHGHARQTRLRRCVGHARHDWKLPGRIHPAARPSADERRASGHRRQPAAARPHACQRVQSRQLLSGQRRLRPAQLRRQSHLLVLAQNVNPVHGLLDEHMVELDRPGRQRLRDVPVHPLWRAADAAIDRAEQRRTQHDPGQRQAALVPQQHRRPARQRARLYVHDADPIRDRLLRTVWRKHRSLAHARQSRLRRARHPAARCRNDHRRGLRRRLQHQPAEGAGGGHRPLRSGSELPLPLQQSRLPD